MSFCSWIKLFPGGRMKALILGFFLVLPGIVLVGCDPGTARSLWEASRLPPEMDHAGLPLVSLASKPLASGEDFALLTGLVPVQDQIVVTDRPWLEGAVHVLAAEDGSHRMTFGRRGQGPGEYSGYPVPLRSPDSEDGEVWLYDLGLRRLTKVDLSKAESENYDRLEIVSLPFPGFPRFPTFLADSMVAVTGYFSEGRVGLWNRATDRVEFLGPFPVLDSDLPMEVLQEAYQGPIVARPDGRRFALACERAGRIDLYSLDQGWEGLAKVPFSWEPDFTVEQRGDRFVSIEGFRNRGGYVDLAASQDRVWALFSGRLEFRFRRDMEQAEYVHEFDWEGRFIRVFKLDRAVDHIAFDEARNRLLATVQEPLPGVVFFPFSEGGRGTGASTPEHAHGLPES